MALRYIILSKADGTGVVHLYANSLKVQNPYPELQYTDDDKVFQMRPGPAGPGNRVHKSLGTNINHAEISFAMHSLTLNECALLWAMYSMRPNVILISLDSGNTRYYAKWKNNGLKLDGYNNNEDPYAANAFFLKGQAELLFLQTTSTNFTI